MSSTPPLLPKRYLHVSKQQHKFSCAHMTLFPDGTKERLHGHNYQLEVQFVFDPNDKEPFYDFGIIKKQLVAVCDELNERMLLPSRTPRVRILHQDGVSVDVEVCKKRYVFPIDEVCWLPISNIVVEQLSEYLWRQIAEHLGGQLRQAGIVWMEVFVTETPGQGAGFSSFLSWKQ